MTNKRFDIGDVLRFGWNVMKANLGFFIGVGLLAGVISFLPSIPQIIVQHSGYPPETVSLINLPFQLIGMLISTIIGIGFVKIALSFVDARKPPVGTLFAFSGCFWRYLGTSILYVLIVLGGFLLLIIPGIIWSIKFSLWSYFVVDKGLGPIQALKASSRTTMGVKLDLFGFGILCSLIVMLGYLCLIVGVLAAYPIVIVANALVYRHLAAQTPELAEFGIDTTYSAAAEPSDPA